MTHDLRAARAATAVVACVAAGLTVGLAACRDSTGPNETDGSTHLRVVNGAFQATDAATDDNPFGCPCTPLSIDVLVDSAAAAPSVLGMAPAGVGGGDAGPAPAGLNAGYVALPGGLHSFVARVSGGPNPTFFTTNAATAYLPKQFLPGRVYHTLIVAGVNPAQPDSGPPVFAAGSAFALGANIPLSADDPFSGPATQTPSGPVLKARLHFVNAAPFSSDFPAVYLTPGVTPPTGATLDVTGPSLIVNRRVSSPYLNVGAGEYTVTFSDLSTGTIWLQAPITLGAGEVRTLILQNTVPAGETAIPAGGPPAETVTHYYKLTNVLDNKF